MSHKPTPTMEAATNALLEQKPAPLDIFASLTPTERAEIRSLARTAALLQSSLAYEPPEEAEQRALEKAQKALAKAPKGGVAPPDARPWWRFWRK